LNNEYSECPLCNLPKDSVILYEDEYGIVTKCPKCFGWILIFRQHGCPTEKELDKLISISLRILAHKNWAMGDLDEKHWQRHLV